MGIDGERKSERGRYTKGWREKHKGMKGGW